MNSPMFSYGKSARNRNRNAARILVAMTTLFLVCLPALSQTSQGTIQGGVFDQSGGAIAGAMVTVTDVARGVTRSLVADDAGQYVASSLNPGTYTVRAEAKGFKAEEHSGVLVEVGQTIRVDMVLQPGAQTQTVTVSGEVPAIDTTDATLGGTVSNLEINALPLNGRNFDRLLQLRPGIITSVGGGSADGPQTNGRRNTDNQLRVEGIAGMAQAQGSDILNATYRTGDADSLMPIDAIQEFNTIENPTAEYGFRDGGFVNVGVKSGTNSLARHGLRVWTRCRRYRCGQLLHRERDSGNLGAVRRHGGRTHSQGQALLVCRLRGSAALLRRPSAGRAPGGRGHRNGVDLQQRCQEH